MATTNPERAAELLRKAIGSANDGAPPDLVTWREQARAALRVAFGADDEWLSRFDDISYGLSVFSVDTPQYLWDQAERSGVQTGVAMLHAALTEVEAQVSEGPTVIVGGLHPWVAGIAAPLWDADHHRTAVEEAARSVEVNLRAKLGISGNTAVPMVTGAFSPKPPKPGEARLRFREFDEDTEPWTNAHEGAMAFGRGCMMRIRNLYMHGHEPSEDEALEALAALSLLARWIDAAEVEQAP